MRMNESEAENYTANKVLQVMCNDIRDMRPAISVHVLPVHLSTLYVFSKSSRLSIVTSSSP